MSETAGHAARALLEGADDSFEVRGVLDRGGPCELYLADGLRGACAGRRCVLKSYRPDQPGEDEALHSLVSEGAILSGLRHPNIVRLFGTVALEDRPWLVLEHVEGLSLAAIFERLGGARLPEPVAFTVAVHLLEALAYLHQATDPFGRPLALCHRDVAPQNLILAEDGATKLLDFGLTEWLHESRPAPEGVFPGTPGFMAPEPLREAPMDGRSDVFAAALLVLALFDGGRSPFVRDTVSETLLATLHGRRRPARALAPSWPRGLSELYEQALSPDPAARPCAARLLMQTLGWLEAVGTGLASRAEVQAFLDTLTPRAARRPVASPAEGEVRIEALLARELEALEVPELPEPEFTQGRSSTNSRPRSPASHRRP